MGWRELFILCVVSAMLPAAMAEGNAVAALGLGVDDSAERPLPEVPILDPSPTPFTNHTNTTCGNGVAESGEQCDDGNRDDGDGCSAACQWETCTFTPDAGMQLTSENPPREYQSDVDGIFAVWDSASDFSEGSDIYLYNLNTQERLQITDSARTGEHYLAPRVLMAPNPNPMLNCPAEAYVLFTGAVGGNIRLYLYSLCRNRVVLFPSVLTGSMPDFFSHDIGANWIAWIESSNALVDTNHGNLVNSLWLYPLTAVAWESPAPIAKYNYVLVNVANLQDNPELDEESPDLAWYAERFTSPAHLRSDILYYDLRQLRTSPIRINGQQFLVAEQSQIVRLTSDAANVHGELALGDGTVVYRDERDRQGDLYLIRLDSPGGEEREIPQAQPYGFDLDDGVIVYAAVAQGTSGTLDRAEIIAHDISTDQRKPLHVDADPADETAVLPTISWPTVVWANVQNLGGDAYCYVLPDAI